MAWTSSGIESVQVIAEAVRRKRATASEVAAATLERIRAGNGPLNAVRETCDADAIAAASRLDDRIAAGEDVGPLAGVPIAVKDNIAAESGHTCCGSRMLEKYRSPFTATAVQRLTNAGAIIIAKANCDEFAMGSSTEHCAFGAVRNPHDHQRVPGGSSGGSAAAVAGGLCPAALGSDTGGSVRQPASFCGVVGVKPSYGRVSRYGLVAFGSSLDQVGPLARNVTDAALLLHTMAGVDRRDATSSAESVPDYLAEINTPIEDLRLGVPREYLSEGNDPAINEAVAAAIDTFRSLGTTIVDIDLTLTRYGIATYYLIAAAEASSNLARLDGVRYGRRAALDPGASLEALYARSRSEGLGPEVQRRIMLGTYALSAGYYDAYYKRASQVRRLIKDEFDRAFTKCHALIGPVSPTPAFEIGSRSEPLAMYLADAYTVNANLAGICGISINCGYAQAGASRLPIGLQIQCQALDEMTMFRIARTFEKQSA